MSITKSRNDIPHVFLSISHQITNYTDTELAFLEESEFIDENGPRSNFSLRYGYLTIGREIEAKNPVVDLELPCNDNEVVTEH